jgi:flagellar protein FliT
MSAAQVIASYEKLSTLSGQMQDAAKRGDWDALVAIEHQRSELISAMKPLDAATTLDEATRQRKRALIESVLAQDGEIRSLVEKWMGEHELSMQSNRQELRLLREYGA